MRILIVSLIKLLFSWFSVNTVTGYLKSIEPLNGTNYPSWYKDVQVAIVVCGFDLALRQDKPAEPADPNGDRTAIEKWERSDRMATW